MPRGSRPTQAALRRVACGRAVDTLRSGTAWNDGAPVRDVNHAVFLQRAGGCSGCAARRRERHWPRALGRQAVRAPGRFAGSESAWVRI